MKGPGLDASLLMQLSDPVLIAGSDGTIRIANTAFQTLSGWRMPLAGRPVRDVIKDWDGTPLARGTSHRIRTSVDRRDGPPLAIELVLSSWMVEGESVTGAIVRGAGGGDAPVPEEALQPAATRAAAEQAAVAYKLLEEVVEMMPQAICVFDSEDRYVLWNHRYADLYPEIAGHLRVGTTFADILRISYASGRMSERADDFEDWLSHRLAKHAQPSWREEQEFADGRWILHDGRRLPSGGAVGMRIDITDIKRREASFRLLFASNPVAMLVFEAATLRILDVNDAACALYGRARAEFLSAAISDLHVQGEREAAGTVYGALVETYEGRTVWHHLAASDAVVSVLIFIRASTHQNRPSYLAAVVDVSDRVRAEARIAHIAHHDPVTGLPNRIRFREVAQAALSQGCEPRDRQVAIHCLDLDGFKAVNDTYGHRVGDMLLAMVGERLLAAVRDGDLVARLGGDEFVVVQTGGLRKTAAVAERLVACLADVFSIQGRTISIGASLGFAVAPRDGTDLDQLIAAADEALYKAKAAGRGTWRAAVRPGRIAAAPAACREMAAEAGARRRPPPAPRLHLDASPGGLAPPRSLPEG